jgi:hypothetical protein
LTPEAAFSHPFIVNAVNELKCLRSNAKNPEQTDETSKTPLDLTSEPDSSN